MAAVTWIRINWKQKTDQVFSDIVGDHEIYARRTINIKTRGHTNWCLLPVCNRLQCQFSSSPPLHLPKRNKTNEEAKVWAMWYNELILNYIMCAIKRIVFFLFLLIISHSQSKWSSVRCETESVAVNMISRESAAILGPICKLLRSAKAHLQGYHKHSLTATV